MRSQRKILIFISSCSENILMIWSLLIRRWLNYYRNKLTGTTQHNGWVSSLISHLKQSLGCFCWNQLYLWNLINADFTSEWGFKNILSWESWASDISQVAHGSILDHVYLCCRHLCLYPPETQSEAHSVKPWLAVWRREESATELIFIALCFHLLVTFSVNDPKWQRRHENFDCCQTAFPSKLLGVLSPFSGVQVRAVWNLRINPVQSVCGNVWPALAYITGSLLKVMWKWLLCSLRGGS